MKKITIVVSILTLFIFAAFTLDDYYYPYPPDHSVMWELRREGDIIIAKIEKYKLLHKKYPSNLNNTGIKLPEQKYGGWQYQQEDNGKSFSLFIGEYAEYLFVMGWDSASKQWWADR